MDAIGSIRLVKPIIKDMLKDKKILLASNSPRRKELLQGLEVNFEVVKLPDIDESYPKHLSNEEIPVFISKNKADAYKHFLKDDQILLTADTIVCLGNQVFGKPEDRTHAIEMLKELSDNTHQVITGVTLCTPEKEISFATVTDVTFSALTDDEICYYVDNFKPFDKAGSYGIQEYIGYIGVKAINGSYFNVMGLPVHRVYSELCKF